VQVKILEFIYSDIILYKIKLIALISRIASNI